MWFLASTEPFSLVTSVLGSIHLKNVFKTGTVKAVNSYHTTALWQG